MTLILTIPTAEGLVMASDSQVTLGPVKTRCKKVFKLNEKCLWGAAGSLNLIQAVASQIDLIADKEKLLAELRSELCQTIPRCLNTLPQPAGPDSEPYYARFMFAEYDTCSRILTIESNGVSVMLEDVPYAIGFLGDVFASTLLQKYQDLIPVAIDNELAAVLAYKIIDEIIRVVSGGIGPPIDIWQSPPARCLTKAELAAVEDSYNSLKVEEINMFLARKRSKQQ